MCAAGGSLGDELLAAVAAMDEAESRKRKYEETCVMARAFVSLCGRGAFHKAAARIEGAGRGRRWRRYERSCRSMPCSSATSCTETQLWMPWLPQAAFVARVARYTTLRCMCTAMG